MSFLVIGNYQFPIRDPFEEGMPMTSIEANVLNWHRARLIQKIVYKWVQDAIDAADDLLSTEQVAALTERIALFDAVYELQNAKEPRKGALEYNLDLLAQNFLRSHGQTNLRKEDIDRIKRTPEIQARARDLIRSSAFSFDELMT